MDRFTYKHNDNWCVSGLNGKLISDKHANYWGEAIDRLAYYEELEEQGRLIVHPCKLGDTVYVIDWYMDCDINEFDVCDDYRKNDEIACGYCRHNVIKRFVSKRKYENQKIEDFGKTVFLTREEAEAALSSI